MAPYTRLSFIFHIVFVLFVLKDNVFEAKPRIEGPTEVTAEVGDNITTRCFAQEFVTWFKFVNNSVLEDEESHTEHFDLQPHEHTEWDDIIENGTETTIAALNFPSARLNDSGVYVCVYELDEFDEIKSKIRRKKNRFYSSFTLSVKSKKPRINVGKTVTVKKGEGLNITCSGKKPLTWVLMNNHTWGVQHTESNLGNRTQYQSVLQIENVNYTDVGYLICKYSDESSQTYDDEVYKTDSNIAVTYLFVKDLGHLLAKQDTKEIDAELSSSVVVPCKPTFPGVKVSLTALDGTEISHDSFDSRQGFVIKKSSKKQHEGLWQCTAEVESSTASQESTLMFISVHYNPVLSGVDLRVGGAWQVNSLDRAVHTFDVVEKDVLVINCSTFYRRSVARIMWTIPSTAAQAGKHSVRAFEDNGKTTERRLIPKLSVSQDSGLYACYVTNDHVNSSSFNFFLNVFPLNSWHLELRPQNENVTLRRSSKFPDTLKWIIFFRAYPSLRLNWTINGETKILYNIEEKEVMHDKAVSKRREQYMIKVDWREGEIHLKIDSPSLRDTGTYVLTAEVPGSKLLQQTVTLHFFKEGPPEEVKARLDSGGVPKPLNSRLRGECSTYGFPFPKLNVFFKRCNNGKECESEQQFAPIQNIRWNKEDIVKDPGRVNFGRKTLKWTGVARFQGYYICSANSTFGSKNSSQVPIIISDSEIKDSKYLQIEVVKGKKKPYTGIEDTRFIEGDFVTITCRGNTLMTTPPLFWTVKRGNRSSLLVGNKDLVFDKKSLSLHERGTKYSFLSVIRTQVTRGMDNTLLTCSDSSPRMMQHSINITVLDSSPPVWTSKPLGQTLYEMSENEKLSLRCAGSGIPDPTVSWIKNEGSLIESSGSDHRISVVNGNLSFQYLFPEDSGKYTCIIRNRVGELMDFVTLEVRDPDAAPQKILISVIGVVSILFVVLLIGLAVKLYIDRKADRLFILEMQKRFNEGNPECLNPDLDLGEQADLLPYDTKFEFPRDRVTIENLLGSGAFGNVFKATARDLISGASKTTVAVKMMKSPANAAQMKTLISELKIMIHIGRHINIVNLLGACSKNMAAKGELLLIVEYCRHGNILEYMRRHKSEFINQINEFDKIDPSMYMRKRSYSNSRSSQRTPTYAQLELQRNSNYFSANNNASKNTHSSNNIIINNNNNNSAINNRASFIENTAAASEKEGRRRIQSDNEPMIYTDMTVATIDFSGDNYINETTLEQRGPLCSRDLLHWSYQIANGMFYLSEKKVIHGDLAARNILLGDKNVVKISDFGLSKNIYKQENYKKKSECPLPVKWLALEALRDSIFSTHSDVWSYGVVLWEMFSLGANPYAGVEVDTEFVTKLEEGLRLSHPQFATLHLYEIMTSCWQKNPNCRPSFRELEKILGDMLGETEKQMYLTLNALYEEDNYVSEHLQYLNTPTYDSRVKGFFTEKDEHGYEMALLSPQPRIMMKDETCFGGSPMEGFTLDPVPKRKRSDVENSLCRNPEERESLLRQRPEQSNYLVMTSPACADNNNRREESPSSRVLPNMVTYANLNSLRKKKDSSLEDRNSPRVPESPRDFGQVENERVFVFGERNQAETDSVFEGDNCSDDQVSQNDGNLSRLNCDHGANKPPRILSYHNKRDSGLYSPNMLQTNPLYVQSSAISNPPQSSRSGNHDNVKTGFGSRYSKTPSEKKVRNQSDSSSGFGSLDDRYTSLEHYQHEKSHGNDHNSNLQSVNTYK